ncbi:Stp1/IreP family PP2C-type Ser/Thr phosphatase [Paenibacillus protaetiae]|uniref:Stp1/IreP family PP2C-type Ser/Thr phosphatase n=1 Tax=Paenibacillus protaetiae TaxID=2509456 RepID=A0A4V0YFN4_9BACL|nr:Stp1/IreP family PP2C-type Ser/Thr phosphatase [Paenibacillus protaetiae]QAY68321.1 Stp1/IreP family PP2C-type Ser/Thr phosphatase [Paenibacillus protaetiae]
MITANQSDVGKIRQLNEDYSWVGQLADGITLAIVADGMGGHQAGDVASRVAVDAMKEAVSRAIGDGAFTPEEGRALIRSAMEGANATVFELASGNEQYYNMGTTLIAALVRGSEATIGHIGDSRVYLIDSAGIKQITEDHSLVNELVRSGQISPEEAAHHPRRNVVTRAVGTDEYVEADVLTVQLEQDAVLLLCSDGLTTMVSDEQLLETITTKELELSAKAERLIQLALQAGGDDNVTVTLLQHSAGTKQEV